MTCKAVYMVMMLFKSYKSTKMNNYSFVVIKFRTLQITMASNLQKLKLLASIFVPNVNLTMIFVYIQIFENELSFVPLIIILNEKCT